MQGEEGAVDRRVELRAVGLGDQDAVAPALADRIDVGGVEAIAHHDVPRVHVIIRNMLGKPLDFDPGAKYVYSNFGYCVLGRVIEKVTG
jgi:CubicO group peptidase (beta-lactamase class C family)